MRQSLAHGLNSDAGAHPVTADPYELAAAHRAGERALEEFPYYQARYAERGQRFAFSDGAWLVTLCAGDWPYIRQQVLWLGGVLSSRGIPRWLLERHLEVLHEELAGGAGESAGRYDGLLRAADHLRTLRIARLPDTAFDELAREFAGRVEPAWRARLPRMGHILVAAVVDESEGIARAVESVEGWSADPARFPGPWCAAVHATLARARRAVSGSAPPRRV